MNHKRAALVWMERMNVPDKGGSNPLDRGVELLKIYDPLVKRVRAKAAMLAAAVAL